MTVYRPERLPLPLIEALVNRRLVFQAGRLQALCGGNGPAQQGNWLTAHPRQINPLTAQNGERFLSAIGALKSHTPGSENANPLLGQRK